MHNLLRKIQQFRNQVLPAKKELFEKLAGGQSPEVLFVTCSDSRLGPGFITGSEPGDLFVIRNAGNVIPRYREEASGGEQGTLEYAVSALKVRHIIVCGHSSCGAMTALLEPDSLAELPAVRKWLEEAKPTLDRYGKDLPLLPELIEANALQQIHNLRTHPCVDKALAEDRLQMHAWVFDIKSADFRTYDSASGRFVALRDELVPVDLKVAAA